VSESGAALADQTPSVGRKLVICAHLPLTMGTLRFMESLNIIVRITTIDHENYRAAWVGDSRLPNWLLRGERWQMLTVEEGKTKYESVEVFSGIIAYVVKFFTGEKLVLGVKAMMEGLKSRAEEAA
jgi:hypothetical protein